RLRGAHTPPAQPGHVLLLLLGRWCGRPRRTSVLSPRRHQESACARVARISSAVFVHMKGFGSSARASYAGGSLEGVVGEAPSVSALWPSGSPSASLTQ